MKFRTAILIGILAVLGLAGTANAQAPTLNTAQKVKLSLVGRNSSGAVVPIQAGTLMVWTATNDKGAESGAFADASAVTGEFSVWYLPTAAGNHTLTVTLTPDGQPTMTNTVVLAVTLDPGAIPTSFTITVGTPVIK